MSRDESDREDLLRQATALVERIELALAGANADQHIVVGFRPGGAASFFFGPDPLYQFNAAGELRRAFCDGNLIKASHGRLTLLRRERLATEVYLLSRELSDAELGSFIENVCTRLRSLAAELDGGRYTIIGQVPADADVAGRVRAWLRAHDGRAIANSPRAGA